MNVSGEGPPDAYDSLHAEIMSGRLSPNERLVENDLVVRYGSTRAAVRMALVRLEQDRMVEREPHRGARVRRVTEAEAAEILETRAALEGVAAGHAARRATGDEVNAMVRIAEEMVVLHSAGDLLGMSERNAQLHGLIMSASRHETVQRLISGLRSQMVRFQYRTILAAGRPSHSLAEHAAIVDAIAGRDVAAAESAMRAHLSNVAIALHERAGGIDLDAPLIGEATG